MISKTIDICRLMGPGWVAERLLYALKVRNGWLKRRIPCHQWKHDAPPIIGRFFYEPAEPERNGHFQKIEADKIIQGEFRFFNNKSFQCGMPPNWYVNPFSRSATDEKSLWSSHWSKIPDFANGDIKCIWELSRFAWVFPLVRSYLSTAKGCYIDTFWHLLEDWATHNPPNRGVHWKCGQEIAIRMFALATAYFSFPEPGFERKALLTAVIHESAQRIEANIGYALSQNNNHGLSEAAGLFTAGVLFGNKKWIRKGSRCLEKQIETLVSPDGSFSQHSANYHRVMLDACLWAIQLGRKNGFGFSGNFLDRIRNAGNWLLTLYDRQTGRMPNLGSNDGASILPFSDCDYLDFRPIIQAVGAVVNKKRWIPPGRWDDLALWLVPDLSDDGDETIRGKVSLSSTDEVGNANEQTSLSVLKDGGYAVLSVDGSKLIIRCPEKFRFRPAQCDLLHVDLWADGVNILRDAGTYSYNCPHPWQTYFNSTTAHNTIQFDDHDQMPKISRFLYGKWPRLDVRYENHPPLVEAGFTDWKECFHRRLVTTVQNGFKVIDTVHGAFKRAILRWRLAPELDWKANGDHCTAGSVSLVVKSCTEARLHLEEGWESQYYMEKTPIPVLETTFGPDCKEITTLIRLDVS